MRTKLPLLIVVALMLLVSGPASAGQVLLTGAVQTQLLGWLGENPSPTFTNIYDMADDGSSSSAFHTHVDGQGRTVTLMSVTVSGGQSFLIGGYNPQSWSSLGYSFSGLSGLAFVFNSTTGNKLNVWSNRLEIVNEASDSRFGFGDWDLAVGRASGYVNLGSAYPGTYGEPPGSHYNLFGENGWTYFSVDVMEVYTLDTPGAVPDPGATLLLLGLALTSLVAVQRRRR